jgi:hypothetical protein
LGQARNSIAGEVIFAFTCRSCATL